MRDDDLRIPPPGYRSAPQRRAEEMRRMLYVGGGAAAVVLLAVIAYFAATGSGSDTVPVIQPPAMPVKVKPADPGGLAVTSQGSGLLTNGSSSAVAPAPETPDPAALAAAAQQEQQAVTPPAPKPAPAPPVAPAPAALAQTAAAPAPAVSVPTVPETPAKHQSHDMAMNVPPPSREAAKTHNLAQEFQTPVTPHHGQIRVQLAALDSRDAAMREWDHLSHRMPDLFAGRHPIFVSADVNGHTYWRVRTAGFASVAEATKFCDDVRAHGGACTVASF